MLVKEFLKYGDKRTRKYKDVEFIVNECNHIYGKESKEVKDLLNKEVVYVIGYEI